MTAHHRIADVMALRLPDVYQFAVMVVLAHHYSSQARSSWPSVTTICTVTGMSKRRVQYALRKLQAAGLIAPIGSTKGGRANSIRYSLRLPCVTGNGAHGAPITKEKGCTDDTERVHGTTVKGAHGAPEPLNHMNRGAPSGVARPKAAPPGARRQQPGESYQDKQRRQLIELAAILRVDRQADESEAQWLRRVEAHNHARLQAVGNA